jgi:hypothetical protein
MHTGIKDFPQRKALCERLNNSLKCVSGTARPQTPHCHYLRLFQASDRDICLPVG